MWSMKKHLRIIGLSNELPKDGNLLVVPFGSYPHKAGKVLQLINEHTVGLMVADFQAKKAQAGFKGLPIYIGHPDVKAFYGKYQDHRSYGWVVDMYANETGLVMEVDWTEPGAELIANEHFAYFSPNWFAYRNGSDKADPFRIKSIGLTQEPMIEYLALACEDGDDEEITNNNNDNKMKLFEALKALLPGSIQETLANENDMSSFFSEKFEGLKALCKAQQARWKAEDAPYIALENEDLFQGFEDYLDKLFEHNEAELQLANEAVPESATATISELNEELTLANESISARETKLLPLMLDAALAAGKITPATRPKWEEKFAAEGADFMALANELDSIDPTMKTSSVTKDLNPGDAEPKTHADMRNAAVQLANEQGCSYEIAYGSLKSHEDFAHLFTEE
jgi:phage I-like protein